jgi:hypothetical protein
VISILGLEVTMPETDARSVATRCLEAWSSGDLETTAALLHENVTFTGPLGVTQGRDAYLSGIRQFAQLVKGVDLRHVFAEGGDVCVIYELSTETAGAIPTAGWYQVSDGQVTAVRAFFDPRPLVPS